MGDQEQTDLSNEQARQGVKIASIEKTCQEIRDCLLGNGKPGLVLRTDRLEQRDKTRGKLFWLVFTTLAAVTAKVLADTLGIKF